MNNSIKIDGFIWLLVNNKAKEVYNSGLFEIYRLWEDGSESLIQTEKDLELALESGQNIGIEVGHYSDLEKDNKEKIFMVVDVSGRGFTTTHTFSQLKNWLGEEMTCDNELAIDAIDDLDVGDKFDCDNIIDSESFTACHIIRTI